MSEDMENALGKEFVKVGNETVVQNALEELNRVDISELDDDALHAYSDALEGLTFLRECLTEPEERRPNARVLDMPWGWPDDD